MVQNRAGALLVARRIALVAGRVEDIPMGTAFSFRTRAARRSICRRTK